MLLFFVASGGATSFGAGESVCASINQACLSTATFGHADVVDFFADAVNDHRDHSNHDDGSGPCQGACHQCHGHFGHSLNLGKPATLVTSVDSICTSADFYNGRCLERIRAAIFRPPIFAPV